MFVLVHLINNEGKLIHFLFCCNICQKGWGCKRDIIHFLYNTTNCIWLNVNIHTNNIISLKKFTESNKFTFTKINRSDAFTVFFGQQSYLEKDEKGKAFSYFILFT